MDRKIFAREFRAVRNNGMTPQECWKWRHGHTFMGHTFSVCITKPFTSCSPEDVMWVLFEAASEPWPTDVQIYFGLDSGDGKQEKFDELFNVLIESGFTPMSLTIKLDSFGNGWIRVPLFSASDLPSSPYE